MPAQPLAVYGALTDGTDNWYNLTIGPAPEMNTERADNISEGLCSSSDTRSSLKPEPQASVSTYYGVNYGKYLFW